MNVQSILGTKGSDVATVGQQASLADAAAQLRDRGVGALVVSDDGHHIDGIVSERDVVRALAAHGAGALGRTVGSVMSTTVVTCVADDSVEELMSSMTERRIRHLPVVDERGPAGRHRLDRRCRQGPPRPAAGGERGPHGVHPPGSLTTDAEPVPVRPAAVGTFASRGAGAELSTLVRGIDDLQPRRRRRRHRLPLAGVGDHPQPAADRPRRRRPAPAVAAVHAARRRDHRPQRPASADGRRQRRARRAHGGRRRRRPRPPRRPAVTGRRRPGRRHGVAAVRRHRSSPRCCSACARCSTTTAPRRSCRRSSRTRRTSSGPTAGCTRPSSSPTSSLGPPLAGLLLAVGLRPADRPRRRDVRRLRRPDLRHRRHARGRSTPGHRSSAGRGGRRWPRASAGCGTTTCCARWPSPSACSTCSARSAAG